MLWMVSQISQLQVSVFPEFQLIAILRLTCQMIGEDLNAGSCG